jgi:hypothetical protein
LSSRRRRNWTWADPAQQLAWQALENLRQRLPIGELGHDEFVGYSTPRNLNDRTYTVVWLALSLDPIDREHNST